MRIPAQGYFPMVHPVRGYGQANRNMVYIGNDGFGVTQTTLSKTFYVQPGINEIPLSFDYYFLSEEVPEYLSPGGCGRCNCNRFADSFFIEVTRPSGATSIIFLKLTTDFPYSPLYGTQWDFWPLNILNIGEPGGDVRPYDLGSYLYDPPKPLFYVCPVWQNLEIGIVAGRVRNEVIHFDEGPGEYTISISVSDWGDEIGDSAIVIDNIRFRPE
jgi:hypothetical protein